LLAPRPTAKLEDHLLSAVRDCLFNIFAATSVGIATGYGLDDQGGWEFESR
jgi:hypothetical protein